LWLDRSFSIRGAGTVVTGTLSAGTLRVGDALELHGRRVTVRGLQTAGSARAQVSAPARVAVNLRAVPTSEVGRGDVLVTPAAWHWTDTIDADLGTEERLPTELVAHLGTAATPARVRRLGGRIARLRTSRPVPVQAGDRLVLRDPGRHSVAAGAVVLDADPPPLRRRGAAAARAKDLADGVPDLRAEVARRGAVTRAQLARLGIDVTATGALHATDTWLVDRETWHGWVSHAPLALDAYATANPLDSAPAVAALHRELGVPADAQLFADVLQAAGLAVVDGRVVRRGSVPGPDRLPPAVHELVDRLEREPFAAPERDELRSLGLGRRELAAAARAGLLLVVSGDIVLLPTAPARATSVLRGLPQPFTTSAARDALGTTRRVVIPLLEHLDASGTTERLDHGLRRLT
jgi:selenocysteine-specific elongation factor